jgi:hypothetical protein
MDAVRYSGNLTSYIFMERMWSSGHKAKRLVLQCINGVSSNPVEGRTII